MANFGNLFGGLAQRANDAFLAPFVVAPNVGLAMFNGALGGTARIGELTAKTASKAGLGPAAAAAEKFSQLLADSTLSSAKKSVQLAVEATQKAVGAGPADKTTNNLLGNTAIEQAGKTAALPIWVTVYGLTGTLDQDSFRRAGWETFVAFSRALDTQSIKGPIPGRVGTETNATVRAAYWYMISEGPYLAILIDIIGITGGFLTLTFGDFTKLAKALPHYWQDMEYVYDKNINGLTQPVNHFPIGAELTRLSSTVIRRFPINFTKAIQSNDPFAVLRETINDSGLIRTLLRTFPFVEYNVFYDVIVFFTTGWLQTGGAQNYALCELAIMESTLSDEEKQQSLDLLYAGTGNNGNQGTAGNDSIEFEYYVPLLVPMDGKPEDQAQRRFADGTVDKDPSVAASVFQQKAINRAQTLNSQVFSLRSFLWLYGDEKVAREKNYQETARKFGPERAEQIENGPDEFGYKPTPEEIAELTKNGPRPPQEVNWILFDTLRQQGMQLVSNRVGAHLPGGLPGGITDPANQIPGTPPAITPAGGTAAPSL